MKFRWLKNVPWIVMGLAHHDWTKAREHGRRCIELYDRQTPLQRHRISCKFLLEGTRLLADIVAFVAGGEMTASLQLEVAVFHLIPLSDRLVEREHLYLGQVARPKVGITLGHHYAIKRLLAVSERLKDPAFEEEYVECVLQLSGPVKQDIP